MKSILFPLSALLLFLSTSCGSGTAGEQADLTLKDSTQFLDDVLLPTLKPFGIGFSMVSSVNTYEAQAVADTAFEDAQQLLGLRQRVSAFDKSVVQSIARIEAVEEIAPEIGLKAISLEALRAFQTYSDQVCTPFLSAAKGGLSITERADISEARRGLDVRTSLEMFQLAQEEFAKSLNIPQDSLGTIMSKYQIKPL